MDLEGFIYEFNLVSTLTVKDVYEWACVLNNNTCKDIDYSNSISLYHLVESFYKLYILYKIDYDKLPKLNLGNVYFNKEDYINVVFKFSDNLLIDYDNSIVKLGDYIVDNKKEVIDMLINNIYINRDTLSDMYCKSYTKRLIK